MMQQLSLPIARRDDPPTSHKAARRVRPGNDALVKAIRIALFSLGAATAFEIAARVEDDNPGRWDEGSIRSALARAGLVKLEREGRSPRGSVCSLYAMPNGQVPVTVRGERL